MEPVEIPININGNAMEEGRKVSQSIDEIRKSEAAWHNDAKFNIARRQKYLADLKVKIGELSREIEQTPSLKGKLGPQLIYLQEELKQEGDLLRKMQSELKVASVGNETLRTKIYGVRNEMSKLVQTGQQNSAQYRQLRTELEQLNRAYQAVIKEQQLMTKGATSMAGVVNGLQGLLGAVTASVGAVGALTGESEKYASIQTKVQSLLAVTIGLQQAEMAFSATSAFRVQTVARAKQAYANVLDRLTLAMRGNAVAAKLMMGVLTGGIGLLVGVGITALDRYISRQRAARKEAEHFNKAVAGNVTKQLANFEKLRAGWVALGGDLQAQKKYLEEHRKAIDETGVAVRDVNDANRIFVDKAADFKDALMERARAVAAFETAVQIYQRGIETMLKAEDRAKQGVTLGNRLNALFANAYSTGQQYSAQEMADYAVAQWQKKATAEFERARKALELAPLHEEESSRILREAGLKTLRDGSTQRAWESYQAEREKALRRLNHLSADAEKESAALVIAAMEEGRKKKMAQLDEELKERKRKIEEQLREIAELEAKYNIDATPQKQQLTQLATKEEEWFRGEAEKVHLASDRVIADLEAEMDARSATRLQRRVAEVRRHYDELIAQATGHARSEQQLAEITSRINAERLREETLIHHEEALEQLDLEERIQLRRLEMSAESYALRADHEEAYLRLSIELAEKRLIKLREIKESGGDAANDIKLLTAEIEELRHQLDLIHDKRLEELATGMKSIFGSLSSLGGELGEIFSALSSSVDSVVDGLKKMATPLERIKGGVQGLTAIWGMARQQIESNKKALEEWNAALAEAAHRQRMLYLDSLDYKPSNLFGVENPYARAISGAKQYAEAMHELRKSVSAMEEGQIQTGTKKVINGANIAKGAGGGAALGAAIGSLFPGAGNLIGAGIGALLGGIFGGAQKKVVPVFESLVDQFGSILKEGTETFELNPDIIASYDKLDDTTKKLVDNWEEVRKKALSAEQEMRDSFRDLAGDLGSNLSQALVKAWRNGDIYSAVDEYGSYVSETIEGIIEQLVFATHFKSMFDELEQRMMDSYADGGDKSIVDDIVWVASEYKKGMEAFARDMEAAKKELDAQGIKIFDDDIRRKAEAKGLARASQDDITKFNGQMTIVVEQVRTITTLVEAELTTSSAQLQMMRAIYSEVQIIARNSEFLRELGKIKGELSIMRREGLKMKS